MTDLESHDRAEKYQLWRNCYNSAYDVRPEDAWDAGWQAARAGNEELRECLQDCYVLLEYLRVSVMWELAPEIKKTIAELVARAEALLERGK